MSFEKIYYLEYCSDLLKSAMQHKLHCARQLAEIINTNKLNLNNSKPKDIPEFIQNYASAEQSFQNALEIWTKAFNSVNYIDEIQDYSSTIKHL